MKLRTDATLAPLTDDQQAQVFDWLQSFGYTETIRRVALPQPDGFGIKTYRASLHRFFLNYSEQLKTADLETAATISDDNNGVAAFASSSEQRLHHSAFQLSTSPIDIETFKGLSRWITRHKTHEQKADYVRIADEHLALARERLALEREKFHFNAARQALLHHAALSNIMCNPGLDNEDKINAAREKLFGVQQQTNPSAEQK